MIEPHYQRIAGLHVEEDGVTGVVWMGRDPDTMVIHIYDCALFRGQPRPVLVEGLAARGRWIPLAYSKSARELTEKLLENGLNPLPDPVSEQREAIEGAATEVEAAMRSARLRVDKRLGEWMEEFKSYHRDGALVPDRGFPLMSATRHAIACIDWAVPMVVGRGNQANYPRLSIV